MLKQIGVRLEEELIKKVRLEAVTECISIQEIFKSALDCYFANKLTNENDNKLESEQVNKHVDDDDIYHLFYVLRKTSKVGKPVKDFKQYTNNGAQWMILDGCRPHLDKDGNAIPFRYTDPDGKVIEPDAEDLAYLSGCYGKQVMVEE